VRKQCVKCGKNKDVMKGFKTPRGRVCITCQRGSRRASTKDARLKESFNITMEQWQQLLTYGGGGCWICGGYRPTYDVDHDHALEKAGMPIEATIRGLLCKRCNRRLLPSCKDDVQILEQAIWYLKNARECAQRVLTMTAEGYVQETAGVWRNG
jgi:hypothetical protein